MSKVPASKIPLKYMVETLKLRKSSLKSSINGFQETA